MSISVVVPVYRNATGLAELNRRLTDALVDFDYEVILVDDGSGDDTWASIQGIVQANQLVTGIRLGRNSGQHSALLAGVRAATKSIIVTIDDDLQNPPEEIPTLVEALNSLDVDVVYGVPEHAEHAGWRRGSSWLVRRTMRTVLGVLEAIHMSSFRAFKTDLRQAFARPVGPGVSLDALLAWATSRFAAVPVKHDARQYGVSQYTPTRLARFAIDALSGYTTLPLRVVSSLGFLTALGGLVLMAIFVLIPVVRGISPQGFPFLASTIILFSGLQLVTLGVIGEYLARMHFRIMNRPEYVIAERAPLESASHGR